MARDLERLKALADIVLSDEMSKLAALNADYRAITKRIDDARATPRGADPSFFQVAAYDAWERWRQDEISRLNMALARLLVTRDHQEQKTRTAVARVQVLKKLSVKARGDIDDD